MLHIVLYLLVFFLHYDLFENDLLNKLATSKKIFIDGVLGYSFTSLSLVWAI